MNDFANSIQPGSLLKTVEIYLITDGMKFLSSVVIILIGTWIARFLVGAVDKVAEKKELDATLCKFLSSIIKNLLYIIVILAALDVAGIQTTSFVAILGAAGLAVGLSLQSTLSNFVSGIMLIIFRPIKVGDVINGAGVTGTVEKIGIFSTEMIDPDNKVIIVPNSKLFSDNITNYSTRSTRRVDMVFGISYSDDIDKAKSVVYKVLSDDARILETPVPQIVVGELADSSVNIFVRPWVSSSDYWGVYFDLNEKIKKGFDSNGITIPFPQRDVNLFNEK
jgi:small conductance mechanosensitive channel